MRACLIPLQIEPRNPKANLEHLEHSLIKVWHFKPDIVCLPECALTGYLHDVKDFVTYAEPIPGPTTEAMAKLAKGYECLFCFGMLERTHTGVYSSAVLMDRTGNILLIHRKNHEKPPFARGNLVQAVDTEIGRVSILICGDLFDEKTRAKLDKRTDYLIVPLARTFDGQSPDRKRWADEERWAYAAEIKKTGATGLLVNLYGGPDYPDEGFGGAMIVSPEGHIRAESLHGTSDVTVFDVI